MNAYQGNNPYVFVSYAHKDNEKVLDLIKLLKRKMCRIWYDEGLTPGGSWNDDLANHISKCECVIIIITNNSIQSQYVKSELNYAISLNKKIYPVFLENVELPAGLAMMLGTTQYIYINDLESETNKLIDSLPEIIFEIKKTPFYEKEGYELFLEIYKKENPNNSDITADCFNIVAKKNQESKVIFSFEPPYSYELIYKVSQVSDIKDDYFIGHIDEIKIINIIANCCLKYPLTGPDFDALFIFALVSSKDNFPKIKLLNTDYVNVITPESLKGGQVENSPWSSNFVETVNKLID